MIKYFIGVYFEFSRAFGSFCGFEFVFSLANVDVNRFLVLGHT